MPFTPPTLDEINAAHRSLASMIRRTPVLSMPPGMIAPDTGGDGMLSFKLELLQHAGSFKARGALHAVQQLDEAGKRAGVVAVSAGNHAIATAFAAQSAGSNAHVVMMQHANPLRVARCQALGANVELVADVHTAFARCQAVAETENRTMMHPFESPHMIMGAATLGVEFAQDLIASGQPPLDAAIIPIGGGGLAAGMAHGLKSVWPDVKIYGVEPIGADSMARSFASGKPEKLSGVQTIADSLGAPFALPMTYELCRQYLDEVVLIDDPAMIGAMRLILEVLKQAVEPAGAAATAAFLGPLRQKLAGQHVGLIVCGANIDAASYAGYLSSADAA